MMNKDLQDLLCSCSSDCIGISSTVNENQRNYFDSCDIRHYNYESYGDENLPDDCRDIDDETWGVLSALRQKFCLHSKSEEPSATGRVSPCSSCRHSNRQISECRSVVEKANESIDYSPESQFLRRIKQQCQYLHNRLPNIFSVLNDCFPENEVNECQKCRLLRSKVQLSNVRSWKCCSQQPDLLYRDKKMRMKRSSIFQRPCSEKETFPVERLSKVNKKKSNHISRSKKRDRSRRFRKRKSNDSPQCLSENEFEPSLKKPNENSCERCWRYASPARSPVNKPDQRFDPNYRRGHSATSIVKGDRNGNLDYFAESDSPGYKGERNTYQDMGKENPCASRTVDATNRSSLNGSQPYTAPHICIKQKMEATWQRGPNECSKRAHSSSSPAPQLPNECPQYPLLSQRGCSQNSRPRPPISLHMQHICPKHMGSFLQSDPPKIRENSKCPIHDPKPPEARGSPQRTSQQAPPQPEWSSSKLRSRRCEPPVPQQSCSEQTSPRPRQPCKQPGVESSRGSVPTTSPKAQSQRPGSCGCKNRSPCRNEDLDVTEYKDICINPKKENYSPCPRPCSRGESLRKTPPCGAFPKTPKPCDLSKMETIPEDSSKKEENKSETESGSGRGRNKSNSNDTRGVSKSSSGGTAKDLSKTSAHDKKSDSSKKNKSGEDSKDSKKGKPKGQDNSSKKSPDKGKSSGKSRGGGGAGRGSGAGGKKVTNGGVGNCGAKKPSQFDKAHPIRPCRCPPRMSDTDQSPGSSENRNQGQTLCCHCDWNEGQMKQLPLDQNEACRSGSQGCYCHTPRQRPPSPEGLSPIMKAGTMECPYRAYLNKFGPGTISPNSRGQQEDNRRFSRESPNEVLPQDILPCTPRKYFMFYMTQERDKKDNNLDVLVEELAQGCSKNEATSRTKDIREKMMKINEPPPDSMALRFQKGVTDGCNVLQNSRMLYF